MSTTTAGTTASRSTDPGSTGSGSTGARNTGAEGTGSASRVTAPTDPRCTAELRVTRSLLGYGVIAGPLYVVVSLTQAAVRDGFDLTRHSWSLLANGTGGWVQSTNLALTGVMVVAAAVGFRRAMPGGPGSRWAPRLLGTYGVGMVGAGLFRADPMAGFPLGTPAGPPVAPTLHGTLHFVLGGIGFLAMVGAALLLARRFRAEGRPARAAVSAVSGIALLGGFAGIASGSTSRGITLAFVAGVLMVLAWLTSTSLHLYRTLR